ncbi:MAG TPA: NUDIX domain-containing protein [Chitinophagaceae bacterium]|nr:NUDIX domain-containing protein [Chitinophagaceae bacterium]
MNRFNIRVYGVLKNSANEILVTDERIRGQDYTKFPGGGLEFGEGTRDCLKREFLEEMNLQVAVGDHLYTTDFFQMSAFNPKHQILSIYYWVQPLEEITARLSTQPFDFDDAQLQTYARNNETESFRFIPFSDLTEDSVSLPIDKIVVGLLKSL